MRLNEVNTDTAMLRPAEGILDDAGLLYNYVKSLIPLIFKILPLRENNEPTLQTYISSFLTELIGVEELVMALKKDSSYVSIVGTLKYLEISPEQPVEVYKREVFKCIGLCDRLAKKYGEAPKEAEDGSLGRVHRKAGGPGADAPRGKPPAGKKPHKSKDQGQRFVPQGQARWEGN